LPDCLSISVSLAAIMTPSQGGPGALVRATAHQKSERLLFFDAHRHVAFVGSYKKLVDADVVFACSDDDGVIAGG
jgi:hypothetical protein